MPREMQMKKGSMKNKLTLRIYRNKAREFSWSFKAGNGERIAQGEGYKRRTALESTIVLMLIGRCRAKGSKEIATVLELRPDITLNDETK